MEEMGKPAGIRWVPGSTGSSKHEVPGPSWMPRVWEGGPSVTCLLLTPLCIFWVLERPPRAPSRGLALASALFHSWARPGSDPHLCCSPQGPPLAFLSFPQLTSGGHWRPEPAAAAAVVLQGMQMRRVLEIPEVRSQHWGRTCRKG